MATTAQLVTDVRKINSFDKAILLIDGRCYFLYKYLTGHNTSIEWVAYISLTTYTPTNTPGYRRY